MICPGVITNVTNFGAFVDIGVHQDGLVHISQLGNKFVTDPNQVVSPGDRVTVKVLEVNLEKTQMALTMRFDEKSKGESRGPRPQAAPAAPKSLVVSYTGDQKQAEPSQKTFSPRPAHVPSHRPQHSDHARPSHQQPRQNTNRAPIKPQEAFNNAFAVRLALYSVPFLTFVVKFKNFATVDTHDVVMVFVFIGLVKSDPAVTGERFRKDSSLAKRLYAPINRRRADVGIFILNFSNQGLNLKVSMSKFRLKKAFLASSASHLFLILIFTLSFNQSDLNQNSGKIEQFEISDHAFSSRVQSKMSTLIPSKRIDPVAPVVQNDGQGSENDLALAGNSYDSALRQKIAKQESYPLEARKRHLEDTISVEFVLNEKGEIEQISSISPGKSSILVNAAITAVQQAAPFSPPPPGISRKFVIPIEFKIK
ncbi:unnamed protein product [Sphagnum jensenii]